MRQNKGAPRPLIKDQELPNSSFVFCIYRQQEDPVNQLGQQGLAERGSSSKAQSFVLDLWGIRYQVADVSRSIDFYTKKLGFKLDHKNLPAFEIGRASCRE